MSAIPEDLVEAKAHPPRTLSGLVLGGLGLAAGLSGDGLLRAMPWGLGAFLWVALLVAGIALLSRRLPERPPASRLVVLGTAVVLAGLLAWRASTVLLALDVLAVFGLAALALVPRELRLARLGWSEAAIAAAMSGLYMAFGCAALGVLDINWRDIPREGLTRQGLRAARGLLLAAPVLLVFGALLTAADAHFEAAFDALWKLLPDSLVGHIALTLFITWGVAGYLRALFFGTSGQGLASAATRATARGPLLGITEVGIVLGLLDALFLAFVVVQFRYFFGGHAMVTSTQGLTYAEYARRGFYELVDVMALALPLLLVTRSLLGDATSRGRRAYNLLAGLMVGLLYVIAASALTRMMLYTQTYGLTESRFFATAIMGWLALALAWFAFTVLRGHARRFLFGALAAAIAMLVGLYALDPDDLIARANLDHPNGRVAVDVGYLMALGDDAVPALLAHAPDFTPDARRRLAAHLLDAYPRGDANDDWRTWNWARARARALVVDRRAWLEVQLHQVAEPHPDGYYPYDRD